MSYRGQERQEIQVQEYVRLQETFNTIIRSLERIERSENVNRGNTVKRNHDADRIHSEYESMKEALITQCMCLQASMTNRKFQSDQIKRDLAEQVDRWRTGIQGAPSQRVNEALGLVYQTIQGRLDFNSFSSGGLPSDHSQAVGNIFKARGDLEEKTNLAMSNPNAYYQTNEYALRFGGQFAKESHLTNLGMNGEQTTKNSHNSHVRNTAPYGETSQLIETRSANERIKEYYIGLENAEKRKKEIEHQTGGSYQYNLQRKNDMNALEREIIEYKSEIYRLATKYYGAYNPRINHCIDNIVNLERTNNHNKSKLNCVTEYEQNRLVHTEHENIKEIDRYNLELKRILLSA